MRGFPRWAWLPFVLGCLFLVVPLLGMVSRVDWLSLPSLLTSERAVEALRLSLLTCVASTLLVLVLGVPLALVLARTRQWWADAVRTLVTVPMVLPPVVAGLALLVTLAVAG